MSNTYQAFRTGERLRLSGPSRTPPDATVTVNGQPLPLRLDLANHSPTGFEWGYLGSGPAQLALAILACEFDDDLALAHYQRFKERAIAPQPFEGFALSSDQLGAYVGAVGTGQPA